MSGESAFQDAVLSVLNAAPSVKALLGEPARAYPAAPAGASFPYLVFGASVSEPRDGGQADLLHHRLTLQVRGRREDPDEVRQTLNAVRSVLHHAELTLVEPWRCVLVRVVYSDIMRSGDRRGWTGLLRLSALIEKLEAA
ncbi:MAG: DUF3168 domain-containing protein [Pseudomonadota bacterium]